MKKLLYVLLLFPLLAWADAGAGVVFEKALTWPEVLAKAKAENKYIFLDFMTTRCGFCKLMDEKTFPDDKVAKLFNEKFISVKVQLNATPEDGEYVKKWHPEAKDMWATYGYGYKGIPAYFFFSPEGKFLHRDIGYKEPDKFIEVVNQAFDPEKQSAAPHYALLEKYRQNKYDTMQLAEIARSAKLVGYKDVMATTASAYRKKYFDTLDEVQLFTYENLKFALVEFPAVIKDEGSKSRFFAYLQKNAAAADAVVRERNLAQPLVEDIIRKEEIDDKLWSGDKPLAPNPDWGAMHAGIKGKYGIEYADRFIGEARPQFYTRVGDAAGFVETIDKQIEKYPPRVGAALSEFDSIHRLTVNAAWVLDNTEDKNLLMRALTWVESCKKLGGEKPDTDVMHTMARLLHKLGRTGEAINSLEKTIARIADSVRKANIAMQGNTLDPSKATAELSATLEKIKKGEPSWAVKKG